MMLVPGSGQFCEAAVGDYIPVVLPAKPLSMLGPAFLPGASSCSAHPPAHQPVCPAVSHWADTAHHHCRILDSCPTGLASLP